MLRLHITVMLLDDSPTFTFETSTTLSKDDMLFDSDPNF